MVGMIFDLQKIGGGNGTTSSTPPVSILLPLDQRDS
jgi:hypothetical protein